MWHLEHELESWFDEVKRTRDEKYGRDSSDRDTSTMMANEYAAGRR